MTQPDSPEDLLHEIYCLYEKDKYAEALAKLEEYYTNKFLEALPLKQAEQVKYSGLQGWIVNDKAIGYNQAIDDITKAIKQLSKRGE